jgi:2-(1,2-epoxy-1,2-dihydrophenyl)acetyl-CoA isomerase
MDPVLVDRDEGVVTVTLNRPEKKNAVDAVMVRELRAVLEDVAASATDRVLVLTGAGSAFCSGADLTDARPSSPKPAGAEPAPTAAEPGTVTAPAAPSARPAAPAGGASAEAGAGGGRRAAFSSVRVGSGLRLLRSSLGDLALALHRLPKPTIAKVNGVAAGMGASLALGCDLVLAADDAAFAQIFVKRGLALDTGSTWLLPRLVGLHKAKELAFFGDLVSAADAAAIGIVNRVVAAAELDAVTADWARRLAAQPPIALSLTKMGLNASSALSMADALEHEAVAQNVCFQTRDLAEAMAAFVERRPPEYRGE